VVSLNLGIPAGNVCHVGVSLTAWFFGDRRADGPVAWLPTVWGTQNVRMCPDRWQKPDYKAESV